MTRNKIGHDEENKFLLIQTHFHFCNFKNYANQQTKQKHFNSISNKERQFMIMRPMTNFMTENTDYFFLCVVFNKRII